MSNKKLTPGKTLIFLDEVQECPEIVTAIKFLVDDARFSYILSGSLLGVELNDIASQPVGYMDIVEMYPLDFEEFIRALGTPDEVIAVLHKAFETRTPVDTFIHERICELFRLYLIIGGMPSVVKTYLETNDIQRVIAEQKAILRLLKKDVAKYDRENKLYIRDVFDAIPSELNNKSKRFMIASLGEKSRFTKYLNTFIWLKDAGVAHPVYLVKGPVVPLTRNKSANLFKLFFFDVGLLSAMYMNNIQLKILNRELDINFGSVFENAVAQELVAHGFDVFYFNSKKQGELDFVVEKEGHVLPLEIKSGKNYARHAALSNVLANPDYDIDEGFVFSNENTRVVEKVVYYPIYLLMFLFPGQKTSSLIYPVSSDWKDFTTHSTH